MHAGFNMQAVFYMRQVLIQQFSFWNSCKIEIIVCLNEKETFLDKINFLSRLFAFRLFSFNR
jgi:hypothetical protein